MKRLFLILSALAFSGSLIAGTTDQGALVVVGLGFVGALLLIGGLVEKRS